MSVEVGKVVEGTVSRIKEFGAFIKLPNGKTGLCHISEVADDYVKDVTKYLRENQKVKVKILSADDKGKISLSIKKAAADEPVKKSVRPTEIDWEKRNRKDSGLSFEDKLSKFLKDSEEINKANKKVNSRKSGHSNSK